VIAKKSAYLLRTERSYSLPNGVKLIASIILAYANTNTGLLNE